ncbi:MAG: hypothetical protein DVB33_10230 [Verrucomicrobia bacterium]|jgi:hypothetical protein|nr:MAG: hypothetical protein DVB33_10230 [Verrucomicrobiota bacterium]
MKPLAKRFLVWIALLAIVREMSAATIRVPLDYSSIQTAINAATNGDLVLVASGIYNEAIDFSGKTITVASGFYETGNSTNILNTVISPPVNLSGVSAVSGESTNSKLVGFTITGCSGLNSAAVYCYQGSLTISDCRIVTNQCRGVIMYKSHSVLHSNEIRADIAYQYDPIHSAQSGPTIEGNLIFASDPGASRDAIYHSTTEAATNLQTVIRSNIIYGRLQGEFHAGGPIHHISHNLIVIENGFGEAVMITGGDFGLKIFNNTIIGGDFNVQLNATPTFFNNIVAFAHYGVSLGLFAPRPEVRFNIFWQCPQISDEFNTNGNTFVDPRFANTNDYNFQLLADSLCIDAGDPKGTSDPDGTRADQGAFFYDQRYQAWLKRYFSPSILADTNLETTVWGTTADPDADRASNLYEYFSACDPLNADSNSQRLQINLVGTNSVLTFKKSKRTVGITSELQRADILPIWRPAAATELPLTDLGDAFMFQAKVSNVGKDRQFFRMKVGFLP